MIITMKGKCLVFILRSQVGNLVGLMVRDKDLRF